MIFGNSIPKDNCALNTTITYLPQGMTFTDEFAGINPMGEWIIEIKDTFIEDSLVQTIIFTTDFVFILLITDGILNEWCISDLCYNFDFSDSPTVITVPPTRHPTIVTVNPTSKSVSPTKSPTLSESPTEPPTPHPTITIETKCIYNKCVSPNIIISDSNPISSVIDITSDDYQ